MEFGNADAGSSLGVPLLRRGKGCQMRLSRSETKQHAFVGEQKTQAESLDYEVVESEETRARGAMGVQDMIEYSAVKWLLVLLIGVSIGSIAFFINLCVENIAGANLSFTIGLISRGSPSAAFLLYCVWRTFLVFLSALLCSFVAPAAAGSGIPEVKAYLNGVNMHQALALPTLLVKILGSIFSVAGGLALGKEGPLVHVGACVSSLLMRLVLRSVPKQGDPNKPGTPLRFVAYLDTDRARHDFVTVGAGAGVAAAFQCPIAGVLFALEELNSWWKKPLVWKAMFTNAVGAIVLQSLASNCRSGPGGGKGGERWSVCGRFGGGGFILFRTDEPIIAFTFVDILSAGLLGAVGGVVGAFFNFAVVRITRLRKAHVGPGVPWKRVIEACCIGLLTASLQFLVPFFWGCTRCPPDVVCPSPSLTGNFIRFTCPMGFYNDMAGLASSTNDNAIKNLFSNTGSEFGLGTLLVFFFVFFFLAIVTHGCAVPAGLFVPQILAGATLGRTLGKLLQRALGHGRVLDEGVYAVLGAASLLGGSMRMTVSLSIMLLEVTGSLLLLPLIMLTMTAAKEIGDCFNDAIVEQMVEEKMLPVLEYPPPSFMKHLTALDGVQTDVIALKAVESVAKIAAALQTTTHNAFPVLDENAPVGERGAGALYGIISRKTLMGVLRCKSGFLTHAVCKAKDGAIGGGHEIHTMERAEVEGPKGPKVGQLPPPDLDDLGLSVDDFQKYVDLHPYANTSPYIVSETMTLRKGYALFRRMALRHLLVVRNRLEVVGVLTRKDLLPETYEAMEVTGPDGSKHFLRSDTLTSWRQLREA